MDPIKEEETAQVSSLHAWDSWDPMGEDFRSEKNTLALNPDRDPLSQITGKAGKLAANKFGSTTICDRYSRYGECADGKYCDKLHVSSKTLDQIHILEQSYERGRERICLNSSYLSPIELNINPEFLYLVTVTVAKSPNNFFFVAPYENTNFINFTPNELQFYMDNESKSPVRSKLKDCHQQLATVFDQSFRFDNLNDEVHPGQMVACKLKNGIFRRALVVSIPDTDYELDPYKLQLIDLGIEVELPRENIYDIRAQFLSEPPLAVNARLKIRPPSGQTTWSDQALNIFKTEARGQDFHLCRILDESMDDMFVVDLINIRTRASLSAKLIELNLAAEL